MSCISPALVGESAGAIHQHMRGRAPGPKRETMERAHVVDDLVLSATKVDMMPKEKAMGTEESTRIEG